MIYDKITEDLKTAMKNGDKKTVSALKILLPEIRNIALIQKKETNDENVIAVLNKAVKQRQNSIEMYLKAGRNDLAQNDQEEIDVINKYLPKMMSKDEIGIIVRGNMFVNNIKSKEQKPQIIKIVMPLLKGKANSKDVMEVIDESLA